MRALIVAVAMAATPALALDVVIERTDLETYRSGGAHPSAVVRITTTRSASFIARCAFRDARGRLLAMGETGGRATAGRATMQRVSAISTIAEMNSWTSTECDVELLGF